MHLQLLKGFFRQNSGLSRCSYLYYFHSSRMRGNYFFGNQTCPQHCVSSTSFHQGKETNLRSLQGGEQCQKGISHACINVCYCCILVNISIKIQCCNPILGQSHRGDRPVMTCIGTVVYHSFLHKHKEGKTQPRNV